MAQRERKERITKKEWYALGGFANRDLFRKQSRGGAWRLSRPLNCRNPWPLWCSSPDEETCERVFTEEGQFSRPNSCN